MRLLRVYDTAPLNLILIFKQMICGAEFKNSLEQWIHRNKPTNVMLNTVIFRKKLLTPVKE